jgi:hypothetical protein
VKRPTYDARPVCRCIFAALATTALSGSCAFAQLRLPITTARQAHHLSIDQARHGYPVRLHAVVTYYDTFIDNRFAAIFVKDSTESIFVSAPLVPLLPIRPGSIVDLEAVTSPGEFAPMLEFRKLTVVGHTSLPHGVAATPSLPEIAQAKLRLRSPRQGDALEVNENVVPPRRANGWLETVLQPGKYSIRFQN